MFVPDQHASAELEKLSGIVQRITFHSVETGYTVLKVNSFQKPQEEIAVIVHQSKVFAGATLDFYGQWTNHTHTVYNLKPPKWWKGNRLPTHALEKYLGSGLIKGVGPVTAKKIAKHF